jgi:hypothetical protein
MPKVKKHKSVLAAKQSITKPSRTGIEKHKVKHTPKLQQQQQSTRPGKAAAATAKAPRAHRAAAWPHGQWRCASVIDQQSAEALHRLLAAAETCTAGATIKSLTLAPHIVHKKPTYAVTVETLKHLPLLKAVLAAVEMLQQHQQVRCKSNSLATCRAHASSAVDRSARQMHGVRQMPWGHKKQRHTAACSSILCLFVCEGHIVAAIL